MTIGNRVFLERPVGNIALLKEYEHLPAADIANTMNHITVLGSGIRHISSPQKPIMVNFTIMIKARVGDSLTLHTALDMAGGNDVVVISNGGDHSWALMGEIMVMYTHHMKKTASIVLGRPICDIDALSVLDFPLYATGSDPADPLRMGPGEVNIPIAVGGVAVCPDDLIVGDADDVIVIPLNDTETVLDKAKKYAKFDASKVSTAKNGTASRQRVKKSLDTTDVEFVDDTYR